MSRIRVSFDDGANVITKLASPTVTCVFARGQTSHRNKVDTHMVFRKVARFWWEILFRTCNSLAYLAVQRFVQIQPAAPSSLLGERSRIASKSAMRTPPSIRPLSQSGQRRELSCGPSPRTLRPLQHVLSTQSQSQDQMGPRKQTCNIDGKIIFRVGSECSENNTD